ncbi:hypothetical protein AJ80_03788 [Polytolypa hystricis UAMH7299]|uniref:Uncharacterized protein n=1 Tax=Polytolypa hystricis (strain UAMH7299) TaxID=1447883 RepID=A0A2B7YFQ7_POLH7|nr:hypothetical protein AJ80_03788 [Polytolypa hystricis UAMH7299]
MAYTDSPYLKAARGLPLAAHINRRSAGQSRSRVNLRALPLSPQNNVELQFDNIKLAKAKSSAMGLNRGRQQQGIFQMMGEHQTIKAAFCVRNAPLRPNTSQTKDLLYPLSARATLPSARAAGHR